MIILGNKEELITIKLLLIEKLDIMLEITDGLDGFEEKKGEFDILYNALNEVREQLKREGKK